jgi:cytochrome bd ubiquinol oxidase subunit II
VCGPNEVFKNHFSYPVLRFSLPCGASFTRLHMRHFQGSAGFGAAASSTSAAAAPYQTQDVDDVTIEQAAAPESSQAFMLFGVSILIPLIICYTAWAYWVFRGKVQSGHGYH